MPASPLADQTDHVLALQLALHAGYCAQIGVQSGLTREGAHTLIAPLLEAAERLNRREEIACGQPSRTDAPGAEGAPWVALIQAHADRRGISLMEISLRAGLPKDAIYDIINRRSKHPQINTLMAIAAALDTTVGALIGEHP